MPPHDFARQTQRLSHPPRLIFKKIAQRLHQLELHISRQSTHIVVGFDLGSHGAIRCRRLNHVGIERSLRKPLDLSQSACLGLEDMDESLPDAFAFHFRVCHTFQV